MIRNLQLLTDRLKDALTRVATFLAQPWREMRLNTEEIAARRRNRLEQGEHNFLWCWQHRGFW